MEVALIILTYTGSLFLLVMTFILGNYFIQKADQAKANAEAISRDLDFRFGKVTSK